jgi:hypothetical protein
MLLPIA